MRNEIGADGVDTFTRLQKALEKVHVRLHTASKDKESGIMNIRSWLMGPNRMPTCYIFEDCERHFYEVARWVYDDENKPCKDCSDHFMENWYRYTLTGTAYTKPLSQRGELITEKDFDPYTGMPETRQQSLWG